MLSVSQIRKSNNNLLLETPIKILELGVNEKLKNTINRFIKNFNTTLFIERFLGKNYSVNKIKLDKLFN